jgi:drug/metabolite transporter (DMT)-like permease
VLVADHREVPPAGPGTWRADGALVVAAFFFGTTFVVVKGAVAHVDPLPFLAVRFLIGAAVLLVAIRLRSARVVRTGSAPPGPRGPASRHEVLHGVGAGLALWAGYALQTFGLQHTAPATSAFLTYMLVVIVPVIGLVFPVVPPRHRPEGSRLRRLVFRGQRLHWTTTVGIVVAVAGLVLLTGGASTGFGRGEVLTLACAAGFAAHIVILGRTAARHDPVRFTAVQLATVGGASLLLATLDDPGSAAFGGAPLAAAAFTGVFATALAFLAMVWAQRSVTPSRAALILLLEPVFAALLSWIDGEALSATGAAGGALILVAVVVAEVLPQRLTPRSR